MRRRDTLARSRRIWDAMAPGYDRHMRWLERTIFAGDREWVAARAAGRVLEVAVGTGRNLPHYPPGLRITGIDLSWGMLATARRAPGGGRRLHLCVADAQALPFASGSFDTVVCTLSLCGIADDVAAVTEMARVLRPGGRLLLLDHVGSTWWPVWVVQWLVERVTVPLAVEHLTRRPRRVLAGAGLEVVEAERRRLGIVERVHASRSGAGGPAGAGQLLP